MNAPYLETLNQLVTALIEQPTFAATVKRLKQELKTSAEPFGWAFIEPQTIGGALPEPLKSCWVFVLKQGVASGCHYHPNSVQHMVMVAGQGQSAVGGIQQQMLPFQTKQKTLADIWYVIDQNVPHEFFPENEDMVVVSFHTCEAHELIEVSCEKGRARLYEGSR